MFVFTFSQMNVFEEFLWMRKMLSNTTTISIRRLNNNNENNQFKLLSKSIRRPILSIVLESNLSKYANKILRKLSILKIIEKWKNIDRQQE